MEPGADIAGIGYFWAAVLGLVQGFAEFLPISSSGHLALVEHLGMGMAAPAGFDVFLHLATLIVVLAYFRASILWYLRNDFQVILYVIVASIPTGIAGFMGKRYFEELRNSPTMICIGLLVTASLLSMAEFRKGPGYQLRDLGWFGAFVVGLCQSMALAPGVSRSGSTIAAGMICGVDRDEAFRFSFIISVPAVGGAVLLHTYEAYKEAGFGGMFGFESIGPYLVGFVLAFAGGWFALKLLDKLVSGGRLVWFAGYCCLAALAGLLYFNVIA